MAHWEFLLQKEGDRSWLPLDTPNVEILEGRYRIVARSSHVSTAAQIRVAHLATEEEPPRRRVQKRAGRTSADGLIVILPYTQFNPGIWDIQCASVDPLSDLTGENWSYTVQLHALFRESETDDWDWSPSAQSASLPPASLTEAPMGGDPWETSEMVDSGVAAGLDDGGAQGGGAQGGGAQGGGAQGDRPAASVAIDAFLEDLSQPNAASQPELGDVAIGVAVDLSVASPAPPSDAAAPPATRVGLAAPLLWSVQLDRDAFVTSRDQVITVSGCLVAVPRAAIAAVPPAPPLERLDSDALSADSRSFANAQAGVVGNAKTLADNQADTIDLSLIPPQSLQICLRDPQNLQILVSESHSFVATTHAIPFSFTVGLPNAANTRLILGEVLLCGRHPHTQNEELVLTAQAFTVTADTGELLNELAKINRVLEGDPPQVPEAIAARFAHAEAATAVNLSFLNKTVPVPGTPTAVVSLAGQPLPPQLYHPEPTPTRTKSLQLPDFSGAARGAVPGPPTAPAPIAAANDVTQAPQAVAAVASNLGADAATEFASLPLDSAPSVPAAITDDPPAAPIATELEAFALDVGLPSPIRDSFQALRLQDRFISRLSSLAADTDLSAALRSPSSPTAPRFKPAVTPESAALAQEVVVDDDPVVAGDGRRRGIQPVPPAVLNEAEPLPTPELQILSRELVAGEPVAIRVKLLDVLHPLQVKLWINDVQTRSLLNGPVWVTGFSPNGHGQMEAATQLTVPFGSTEIRFEAIAVELSTQRESRKVVCDRSVVPPDVPSMVARDY